jgi:hypothetical protein
MRKEIMMFLSFLIVGVLLWGLSNLSIPETYDYGTSTLEILAGDEVHPGFRAVSFSAERGDVVRISFSSDVSVSCVVTTEDAYRDWGRKYYTQSSPPDLFRNYPNYGSTWRSLSDEIVFVAPEKGEYVAIFLNPHPYYAHVTVRTTVMKMTRIEILSYCGIAIGLIGMVGLAYQLGRLSSAKRTHA